MLLIVEANLIQTGIFKLMLADWANKESTESEVLVIYLLPKSFFCTVVVLSIKMHRSCSPVVGNLAATRDRARTERAIVRRGQMPGYHSLIICTKGTSRNAASVLCREVIFPTSSEAVGCKKFAV
jgi:hypothetical protein